MQSENLQGLEGKPGVYFLIIGESQNRLHMSAYGYDKETTPWLDSMKDDPHCILFTQARSCHTHTVQVLAYALTAKNQYNDMPLEEALSLIEVAKAAGFRTIWLSNQARYGAFDTPISVIASEADEQVWLNQHTSETYATSVYDGKLVDALKNVTLAEKTLVVVHLMGNHGSYIDRYPPEWRKDDDTVATGAYDNSIRYNDAVMQDMYETMRQIPGFAAAIYFADHADDVDAGLAHDANQFTQNMTKIPLYMLFSDDYRVAEPEKIQELTAHRTDLFTNDLIFNTMLALMNIYIPNNYEPANDVTRKSYDADSTRFRTLYGQKALE